MEAVEARFPGIKVFSLPSVDHPQYHIELGVKDDAVFCSTRPTLPYGSGWTRNPASG